MSAQSDHGVERGQSSILPYATIPVNEHDGDNFRLEEDQKIIAVLPAGSHWKDSL